MKVTFLQSADRIEYRRLIEVTSLTLREYCSTHGTDYHQYLGIKVGSKPWQAALNRIPILKSYVDEGYRGWIIYLDADAYIADLDFDIWSYLKDRSHFAVIAAPSGVLPPRWWDINNGVVAFNLGQPATLTLINRWHERLKMNSDEALENEAAWGEVVDDQDILHESLKEQPELEPLLLRDDGPGAVFNWDNRFIRQRVRLTGTLATRVSGLNAMVEEALGSRASARERGDAFEAQAQLSANAEFVRAIYTEILGREPDAVGFEGVTQALKRGERTYSQELNACLRSPEFEANLPQFIKSHFSPQSVAQIMAALAA